MVGRNARRTAKRRYEREYLAASQSLTTATKHAIELKELKIELNKLKNNQFKLKNKIQIVLLDNEKLRTDNFSLEKSIANDKQYEYTQWAQKEMQICEAQNYIDANTRGDCDDDIGDDISTLAATRNDTHNDTLNNTQHYAYNGTYNDLHYVWWRVPVWFLNTDTRQWTGQVFDLPFCEIVPCTQRLLNTYKYITTPDTVLGFSDAIFLNCGGCSGCC